jgi:hypothetical protein
VHFPWFSSSSALRGRASRRRVWDRVRQAPPRNITVSPYIRADRIALQFFPFLSELSQVLCSDGGRVTPSARAYFLRRQESYSLRSGIFPQSPQDQPGDWISLVDLVVMNVKMNMLGLVVMNVKKNIANESAARSAIGHFGQEVSKIEPSPDVSDKRFAHGNRFTDCMVANQIAFLLKG